MKTREIHSIIEQEVYLRLGFCLTPELKGSNLYARIEEIKASVFKALLLLSSRNNHKLDPESRKPDKNEQPMTRGQIVAALLKLKWIAQYDGGVPKSRWWLDPKEHHVHTLREAAKAVDLCFSDDIKYP